MSSSGRTQRPYAHPSGAIVPLLETLVDANGLINHTFTNLTFSHATWRQLGARWARPDSECGDVARRAAWRGPL